MSHKLFRVDIIHQMVVQDMPTLKDFYHTLQCVLPDLLDPVRKSKAIINALTLQTKSCTHMFGYQRLFVWIVLKYFSQSHTKLIDKINRIEDTSLNPIPPNDIICPVYAVNLYICNNKSSSDSVFTFTCY